MSVSKNFVSHIFALVAEQLARAGFRKQKMDIYTITVSEEVAGWLGLNKALYRGGVLQINPVVGVRHQKLETRVAELLGQKPHQYIPASISTNIGYLMKQRQYAAWSFQDGEVCEASIAEMVAAITSFGQPFMQENATLAMLYSTMINSKHGVPPDPLDYRIAVASDLLGKHADTDLFVDAKLREIGSRNDEAAEWFRKFAAKLREG